MFENMFYNPSDIILFDINVLKYCSLFVETFRLNYKEIDIDYVCKKFISSLTLVSQVNSALFASLAGSEY